jgi:hypothetical protein
MGAMLLDELNTMKILKILKVPRVLKQAHIEPIHSNRLKQSGTILSEYDWKGYRGCGTSIPITIPIPITITIIFSSS